MSRPHLNRDPETHVCGIADGNGWYRAWYRFPKDPTQWRFIGPVRYYYDVAVADLNRETERRIKQLADSPSP